jgi:Glycosyl transferases group 1
VGVVKLLVIAPGPAWSVADVEAGLIEGLRAQGVTVVHLALGGRLAASRAWLRLGWQQARRRHAALPEPTPADVAFHAGLAALERALTHQVDAVISVSNLLLHPHVLVLLRRAGVPVTVLLTESPYDEAREFAVARLADAVWTTERTAVVRLQTVCPRVWYLRHAWHPLRHLPGPQPGDEQVAAHDVVFVGSGFSERIEWFRAIEWTGIDLGLYGHWQLGSRNTLRRFVRGGQIGNATTAALYRRAKIGLNLYRSSRGYGRNVPRLVSGQAESCSPRAYELAACGAFHLSEYRAEVAEQFGGLVPLFETPTQAARLIRHYLADDAGRAPIRTALPATVAGHSWRERARQVITDLESLIGPRLLSARSVVDVEIHQPVGA